MKYVSTRGASEAVTGAYAIVSGLTPEGALYVPEHVPGFPEDITLNDFCALTYPQRATKILAPWLSEFSLALLGAMCTQAYASFDTPDVVPVKALSDNIFVLELFHGPTLAFKDMALQLLPHLLTASARLVGETRDILILVATSGDTGKAALMGFANKPGVRICVFYPDGGVSLAQKLQMVTQTGDNTRVVAVRGNFDDAQTGVKQIFVNSDCVRMLNERNTVLSSANSINLGRLIPQIAYYWSSYADLINAGAIECGDPINICVPTGNFGNILAAEYARQMGLPVHKLICASNENHVLTDFIRTGVYDKNRDFHLTTSPSMDILISSNLERLLFELANRDGDQIKQWMDDLKTTGRYALTGEALDKLQSLIWAGWADEKSVAQQIEETFCNEHYLLDPHTAVAMHVARDYRTQSGDMRPMLIAATASPYKFGKSVLGAIDKDAYPEDDFAACEQLAALVGESVPEPIAVLRSSSVRHEDVCDIHDMWQAILPILE